LRFVSLEKRGYYLRKYNYSGKITPQLDRSFYYPPLILDDKTPKHRPIVPINYKNDELNNENLNKEKM